MRFKQNKRKHFLNNDWDEFGSKGFFETRLPFAASEVILREPRVLGPGAGEHLGIVGKIKADAEREEASSEGREFQR